MCKLIYKVFLKERPERNGFVFLSGQTVFKRVHIALNFSRER